MPQSKMTFLECKISKGLFEDERIVESTIGDRIYKTIVDREDVEENQAPQEDKWVEGRLQVYIVKRNGETVLVNLPRETAGNGRRLSVPENLLQSA